MNTAAPPSPSVAASGRGQYAVLGMIGVAVLAAAFAWWWNYSRSQRPMALFGPEAAALIKNAPQVKLSFDNVAETDISRARGLLNARTSLLNDASYDWPSPAHFQTAQAWIRFAEGDQAVTVFFDLEHECIQVSGNCQTAKLSKKAAEGWNRYLARQHEAVSKSAP